MTIYDTGPYVVPALLATIGFIVWAVSAAIIWLSRSRRLRRAVFSNLDSAYANGYFEPGEYLHGVTARSITFDLRQYACDMAEHDAVTLLPHVRAWLDQKGL